MFNETTSTAITNITDKEYVKTRMAHHILKAPFSFVGLDEAIPNTRIGMHIDTKFPKTTIVESEISFPTILSNKNTAHKGIDENVKKSNV